MEFLFTQMGWRRFGIGLVIVGAGLGCLDMFSVVRVEGNSMVPSINHGDWLLVLNGRWIRHLHLEDVVLLAMSHRQRPSLAVKRLRELLVLDNSDPTEDIWTEKNNAKKILQTRLGTKDGVGLCNVLFQQAEHVPFDSYCYNILRNQRCRMWVEGDNATSHDSRSFGWLSCTCLRGRVLLTLVKG